MCRIVGGIDFTESGMLSDIIVANMRDSMMHGGPDAKGIFSEGNVVLGHRRLAILDLSKDADQPMVFKEWVIVFNGEIYNYNEIRISLKRKGVEFRTNSDTEVIVKSFEVWGYRSVERFRGMFAFALYNRITKKLILCRDRFGVKPLYYYCKGGLFMFSSELKAFHECPQFDSSINRSVIPHYLSRGYINESSCIYSHVSKVYPGSYLIVENGNLFNEKYWDVHERFSSIEISKDSELELCQQLEEILIKSFSLRLVSDVPLGVFLSGGIDSSLITAVLQSSQNKQLHTFNIGFEDKNYNESEISKKISQILETKHSSILCKEEEFLEVVPELPKTFDEPFGDSSAIATILLSKFTKNSVKVALSGDGGDELFGGYAKYKFIIDFKKYLNLPITARKVMRKAAYQVSPDSFERYAKYIGVNSYSQLGDKFYKLRHSLDSKDISDLFYRTSNYLSFEQLNLLFRKSIELQSSYSDIIEKDEKLISNLGVLDITDFLPSDVLTKGDRASMSMALEVREPFLDPEILDFSFSIPSNLKVSKTGETKYLLKRLLSKYLPQEIINIPKRGFTIPIFKWIQGPLNDEVRYMLTQNHFFEKYNLNQIYFSSCCNEFLSRNRNNSINPHVIWFVYCLYKWDLEWN